MKADKKEVLPLLKTARGQLDGIIRMVDEDQYCMNIANQVMAADAVLKKAYRVIMRGHLKGCVKDAFLEDDEAEQDQKIDEIICMIEKMSK